MTSKVVAKLVLQDQFVDYLKRHSFEINTKKKIQSSQSMIKSQSFFGFLNISGSFNCFRTVHILPINDIFN